MDKKYLYVGVALLGFGMFMGHLVASIIFFGILSAASLVVLVESNKAFKLFCGKYGFLLDLLLFILSGLAVAFLGVTVAGGLAVASLIFTIYRLNFLKPWFDKHKLTEKARSFKSYISEAFNSVVSSITSIFKSEPSCVAI